MVLVAVLDVFSTIRRQTVAILDPSLLVGAPQDTLDDGKLWVVVHALPLRRRNSRPAALLGQDLPREESC